MHAVLSLLGYCLKAPVMPPGVPVVNSLFRQREALSNVLRACLGLPPEAHMALETRFAGLAMGAAGGGRNAT
jgi:myo-inositol-1-phosphate synthase